MLSVQAFSVEISLQCTFCDGYIFMVKSLWFPERMRSDILVQNCSGLDLELENDFLMCFISLYFS